MDGLLNPVRTVRKVQNNIQKFESLKLGDDESSQRREKQPARASAVKPKKSIFEIDTTIDEEPLLQASTPQPSYNTTSKKDLTSVKIAKHKRHDSTAFLQQAYLKETPPSSLSDNAREILKSQPNHADLKAVLEYLQCGIDSRHDFDVRVTGPKAASIINVLVTVTVPDIWTNIRQKGLSEDEARMKKTILASLSSIAGLGALLAQIKYLSSSKSNVDILADTIMVLGDILKGQKTVIKLMSDVKAMYSKEMDRKLFWQEMTALLAGSRILSVVAQAFDMVKSNPNIQSYTWLSDGPEYTAWLARNATTAAQKLAASDEESWKFLGQLVKRGLSLGHRGIFVSEIYTRLLLGSRALWTPIHLIMKSLEPYEQKIFFDSMLSDLARNYLTSAGGSTPIFSHDSQTKKVVAGAAALIAKLVNNNEILKVHIEHWLTSETGSSAVIGLGARRALVATLGRSEESLQRILQKSLATFGDKLHIQHSSIIQQEATAQTILLIIGHLNRIDTQILKHPSISTLVMHAVSNRLAASIPRTRLLGMIVGTAVSKLTDEKGNVIDFGMEEMESDDVKAWLELVSIDDQTGDIADLKTSLPTLDNRTIKKAQGEPVVRVVRENDIPQTSKIIAIEEVSDSEDSEDDDDDLAPYQKPDSDPEDSEDDATLINRDKPSAPVYIIDLIKQLQTTDKPDVISLALKTAPTLIRRKATFGTELSDNVRTLVTVLINLQPEGMFETELQQQQLRLQSVIECLVAKPEIIGPALADTYFQGDFSLSQRITILTAIGLGARRLAGYKTDDSNEQEIPPVVDTFPSKRLPAHLSEPSKPPKAQTLPPIPTRNAVAMLTNTAAHTTIRPMALSAADQLTGPSILKIRTFSSRLDVERRTLEKNLIRSRTVPKNLHRSLVESIYLPLCSRMSLLLSHHNTLRGSRGMNTTILHSSTLRLLLQTLTLTLHTLGPQASLHLPTLTHETLLLLNNLHTISRLSTDPAVLPALLHLLLELLDVTVEAGVAAQERLIDEYGGRVVGLVGWSSGIGDTFGIPNDGGDGGGGGGGGMPWTVLAAGIQVKWFEIGRRFQGRMLGLSLDEMDLLQQQQQR